VFGVDMTAYFAVRSGETCNFPMRLPGEMLRSGVSQKPAHGTLRQINVTTFRYTAASGYKGNDTFASYGEGRGPYRQIGHDGECNDRVGAANEPSEAGTCMRCCFCCCRCGGARPSIVAVPGKSESLWFALPWKQDPQILGVT
jgi:hypothetical protein